MYCPNCNKEYEGKFCPECGTKLIEKPSAGGFNLNLGDANAISGGVNLSDSHNVHNEDNSVHNISNVSNITNVAAQKTDMELLQEKKNLYLNECKRAYEDNVLEQSEVIALEEYRIKIGLDKVTADSILDSVRVMTERNARKTSLNPIAKTKLKILTDNLQKNEVKALMDQIDGLEALVNKYEHDELSRKYFLVLAALKPEKCINLKENSKVDSYWKSFWSYLAYIKVGRSAEAENVLVSLDRFADYPEDNMTVLAVAGALMNGSNAEAKEYLDSVTGDYTPALQRFVDSIYLLLAPELAKEMSADANTCAFYLVNFFNQEDPKERARKEAEAKAAEEAKCKAKEEAESLKDNEERKRIFPYSLFWVTREGAKQTAQLLTYNALYTIENIEAIQSIEELHQRTVTRVDIISPWDYLEVMKNASNDYSFFIYPKDISIFECYNFCNENNIDVSRYVQDIQYVLVGAIKNLQNDNKIEYSNGNDTFIAELGGGLIEMLGDTPNNAGIENEEITIRMNSSSFEEDLLRGCIFQVSIFNKSELANDCEILEVTPHDINLISKVGDSIREVVTVSEKYTISSRNSVDITLDDSLYLEGLGRLVQLPIDDFLKGEELTVTIDCDVAHRIGIKLSQNNLERYYSINGRGIEETNEFFF